MTQFFSHPAALMSLLALSAPYGGDTAIGLVDELKIDSLAQMKAAGLEKGKVAQQPWSGWYWPLSEGGLAYRYGDSKLPKDAGWATLSAYLTNSIGKGPFTDFSPAEKYDYLVGDSDFTLTNNEISIASDFETNGQIEGWLGYCTGWANASMNTPRPKHSVTLVAADGHTQIEFLPSDIKALGALLWANGLTYSRSAGTLCTENPVRRDPINDRPINERCRDTNPATWHLAVVNQVGIAKRSLLIDSDSGYQVWNQPVQSYSYRYFNPQTEQFGALEQSTVDRSHLNNDRFSEYRASATASIVGVEMQLTFVYETRPNLNKTDSAAADEIRMPVYRYDLEMDKSGRIIGGEWHSRLHPDMLWVSPNRATAESWGDQALQDDATEWLVNNPVPPAWTNAAQSSSRYTQPLGHIVRKLFEWSVL